LARLPIDPDTHSSLDDPVSAEAVSELQARAGVLIPSAEKGHVYGFVASLPCWSLVGSLDLCD